MRKPVIATGRRKAAVARAVLTEGSGRVYLNGTPLETCGQELVRLKIMEPLLLAGELAKKVDVRVNVRGGGVMGQADAARTAVARGLIEWAKEENPQLRETFRQYDWTLIKSDTRFKLPKKPEGYGARAKYQKSYR
ncbi:MAG: 30S ribosomal protein S9 [Candidatus Hadarchaeales archaeon]